MAESVNKIGKDDVKKFIGKDDVKKFIVKYSYGENARRWPKAAIVLSTVDIHYTELFSPSNKDHTLVTLPMIDVYRSTGQHAEGNFLSDLRKQIDTLLRDKKASKICVEAYLVQNYSPCNNYNGNSGCADDILEFKEDMENREISFSLTIKFANFYLHKNKWNSEGLQKLVKENVTLKVFQGEDDWKAFLNNDNFVTLTTNDKKELLERATSKERVKREEDDEEILKDIIGKTKYNKAEANVEDLTAKMLKVKMNDDDDDDDD